MLNSPAFLYTMSDFSRFAALFVCYRLQSAHFHLLISKDAFAIIAPQILLAHPPILLWQSSSHPNIVICFIVISTYHILYSSVLQRKTFEQHLRHEYFFAFSQAFAPHLISLIFNALYLINLYIKCYYFTTKIRLRCFLS